MYINEIFNNIKTLKLYSWEPDFLRKVDGVFQEELAIDDEKLIRQKIYDIIDGFLQNFSSLSVIIAYTAMGSRLTLSQFALTNLMLQRV